MAAPTPIDPIKQIGNDATATFENDPKFIEPTPGSEGSSENVEEQRKAQAGLFARDTDDLIDSDEDEDVEDEDDEDDEDDEEYEDEDDEEYEDEDDEDDEELEDDEDEVAASPALVASGSDLSDEPDDDAGDVDMGVSEDEITEDDLDTDRLVAAAMKVFSHHVAAMSQHSL
ncbi:MAG: hypothetical protein PW792_00355 [Acidobacteriaceae bacterium]|nr:hypothetical protein [Acidobacteriaceae bacterium]